MSEEHSPSYELQKQMHIQETVMHGNQMVDLFPTLQDKLKLDKKTMSKGILFTDIYYGPELLLAEQFDTRVIATEPNYPDDKFPNLEGDVVKIQDVIDGVRNSLSSVKKDNVTVKRKGALHALKDALQKRQKFALITRLNVSPRRIESLQEFVSRSMEVCAPGGAVLVTVREGEERKRLKQVADHFSKDENLETQFFPISPYDETRAFDTALGMYAFIVKPKRS